MSKKILKQIEESIIENCSHFTQKYADKMNGEVDFHINKHLITESVKISETTVGFHNLPTRKLDHYKYASHISLWFSRLKPIEIIFRDKNILDVHSQKNEGYKNVSIKVYSSRYEGLLKSESLLINEFVAIDLAFHYIQACQLKYIDSHYSKILASDRNDFEDEMLISEEKLKLSKQNLAYSLRNFHHTCRTWNLLLESKFKTSLELNESK